MECITIYTDGAARGNGRENTLGCWGAILEYKGKTKKVCGIALNTTNNIMELQACIEALKTLKKKDIPVKVYSDSSYVVTGITEWVFDWIKKGWVSSKKDPIKNKELWMELHSLRKQFNDIQFIHVNGHSDCEGNNQVDKMLNDHMDQYVWHETIHQ